MNKTINKNSMRNKVNIEDFLILIYWVQTFFSFEGKPFKYQHLVEQAETYAFNRTPLDTKIHYIDDFLIDAYKVYQKLKFTEKQLDGVLYHINLPFINKDAMMLQTKKFMTIFDDIMENCLFEDAEICGIQKGILTEKMNECVGEEDYEKAAVLRDIIKIC